MATMKPKMTFDELTEAYAELNPEYAPNRVNVGKFAKRNGYRRHKQMIQYKMCYFYLKTEE